MKLISVFNLMTPFLSKEKLPIYRLLSRSRMMFLLF